MRLRGDRQPPDVAGPGLPPRSSVAVRPPACGAVRAAHDRDGLGDRYRRARLFHHAGGAASAALRRARRRRSEEHTSELQSLMRISYAVFCLNKNIWSERQITHQPYDRGFDTALRYDDDVIEEPAEDIMRQLGG